jgi:hypothetical protein
MKMVRRQTAVRLAALVLGAIPLAAGAQQAFVRARVVSATAPARPFGRNVPIPYGAWTDAAKWMQDNCPNRWQAFEQTRDKARRSWLQRNILRRYVGLQQVRQRDTELADLLENQAKLQDHLFGEQLRLNKAPNDSQEQQNLRETVKQLVDNDLEIRQRRVAKLRETIDQLTHSLKNQSQRLEHDQKQHDTLVDNWYKRELERAEHPPRPQADAAAPETDADE